MVELDGELVGVCGLYCDWCPYYVAGTVEFRCGGCWTEERQDVRVFDQVKQDFHRESEG